MAANVVLHTFGLGRTLLHLFGLIHLARPLGVVIFVRYMLAIPCCFTCDWYHGSGGQGCAACAVTVTVWPPQESWKRSDHANEMYSTVVDVFNHA